jgi:hypothetical protein
MNFEIVTLDPAPAMTETIRHLPEGTSFAEAVEECHKTAVVTGRRTSVVRQMFYWYWVKPSGEVVNRNTGWVRKSLDV